MFKKFTSKKFEVFALFTILIITLLVYLNHFDNPFFFDDVHTINNNKSIRTLKNWTTFFTDASTFSSLPPNQSYRPMITLMNALDYNFGGGLNQNFFHYHIFFWFFVLIVLIFFLSKLLFKKSDPSNPLISLTALFSCAWFALHTSNAETINYICARSDSFSSLCVVASLLIYTTRVGKKWFLYLITGIIGVWTKQTAVMFLPILIVYIILFEEYKLIDDFKEKTKETLVRFLKKIAPTAIIIASLFLFNQFYLTPSTTVSSNQTITRFEYISTQLYVTMHYLGNFILPINLSADPDISIIKPWFDYRIIIGFLIVIALIIIMLKTSLKKEFRPISFGIAWFFIASLPTSITPLFQIANDHRTFFPFIGLFIAVSWSFSLLFSKFKKLKKMTFSFLTCIVIIIIGHSVGTFKRNEIWGSKESLWQDVTIKSPKNGRGLMNYGLTHMSKGDYATAEEYFNKALKYTPNYYSLHINLGILYGATKKSKKANQYFKSAIAMNSLSPAPEYFYARYLSNNKKYKEAKELLEKALLKSPNHLQSKTLLNNISGKVISTEQEINILKEKLKNNPNTDVYIKLSLNYYKIKEYELAISTAKNLLKIDPNNILAYNNICSSYNQLGQWKLGAEACKKALKINPNYQLAKNNLKWSTDNIKN